MKSKILLIILILVCPITNYAQEDSDDFDKLIKNWEYFHLEQDYQRAIIQIDMALEISKKTSNREHSAIALNRKARSLMKSDTRVKKNRKEAIVYLEESLLFLTGIERPELRIDNLERLKWLAEEENDQEKAAIYTKQISAVEVNSKENTKNEVLAFQAKELAEQKKRLTTQKEMLASEKKVLVGKIDSLNEVQLKSKLLLAMQKIKMDSFVFSREKDSLVLEQKELLLAQQSSKMALQETEISLKESQRNLWLALAGIIGFLGIGVAVRYLETKNHNKLLETKNKIIEEEKLRSEELLLNILPALVAKELKATGVAKAKRFEGATVLFADFVNFSGIAKKLTPEELVHELDLHFKAFDKIIGEHNLEKIKTIGDAYMCVGGLPEEKLGHTRDVIKAALAIQKYLDTLKQERIEKGQIYFEARIGIHTGPLVAGVVGSKKFAYDIWGDTVNVAARMESKSEAGKVNISSTTFKIIGSEFDCSDRGNIPIKNLGEIGMFFVKGVA